MATTNYLWDPLTDSVVHETDGSEVTQATYTSEPAAFGPLVSQRRGATTIYHHFDALGSTRQLTNAAQSVTDSYMPSAWGEEVASAGVTTNPFCWIGRMGYSHSRVASSYCVRRRTYWPNTARWGSVDPLGIMVSNPNIYQYGGNSPLMSTDPSGTDTRFDTGKEPFVVCVRAGPFGNLFVCASWGCKKNYAGIYQINGCYCIAVCLLKCDEFEAGLGNPKPWDPPPVV